MFSHLRFWLAVPLLIVLICAQAAPSDPPSRVGRLSLLDGDVSMRREDSRLWEDATLNFPLTAGDEIATGDDGLAEIRIGSSTLRVGNRTAIDILRLDDERIRVRLDEGSVALRVRSAEPQAAIEVETREGAAIPVGPGQFRVDHDGSTVSLTSYRGALNFRSDDSDIIVSEGRRAHVYIGEGTSVRWDDPEDDDFAEWVFARDRRDDALGTPRHVSPEMTGAEDLYEYGDWQTSDEYGEIWYPRNVAPGWAPYRSGRWVSVAPWGWTWVDEAPWGFAPFHYGRWVLLGHRWAWVPGRYVARPVYAPALVVWLGLPGVVLSSGPVHVGWFPLAPHEIYLPSYRYSPSYIRQINVTHVTNVVEITRVERDRRHARYAYRDHRDAVTLVRDDVLRKSRPVFRDAKRLDDSRWQFPRVATPVPPFEPLRRVGQDRGERLHDKDIRPDRRAAALDRDDADERRRRDDETSRRATARFPTEAEERRPGRFEPIPQERRDNRRDAERERRDVERRERIRAFRPQDGLEPMPRQSQPEREQRLDSRLQREQERRERDQQQLRQQQFQQSESRRQAEALRRSEQQQIEQRSRQALQHRTDDLRRQQELRDRSERQFEQQRQRDAQERQRFTEQQREHERDRRAQRQAIDQQRELQREQQQLGRQQSRQERQERRPTADPGRRHDGDAARGRP